MEISTEINKIVKSINNGRCVILLGPKVAKKKDGQLLHQGLLDYLIEKDLDIKKGLDGLFICEEKRTKTEAYDSILEYFQNNQELNELHKQLARIPCHFIISVTPDLMMKKAFDDYGISHEFQYYAMNQKQNDITTPSADTPLLYNLFGSITDEDSLILTPDDLLEFLFSIIRRYELPREFQQAVDNAKYFIFLGFDFGRWYVRLLLKLFQIDEYKLTYAAEEVATKEEFRAFFISTYGMVFIEEEIADYVNELYTAFPDSDLREIKEPSSHSIKDELKELIGQDELENVFDKLLKNLIKEEQKEMENEILNLDGQYSGLEKDIRRNRITLEKATIERTRIRDALLSYIDELEV